MSRSLNAGLRFDGRLRPPELVPVPDRRQRLRGGADPVGGVEPSVRRHVRGPDEERLRVRRPLLDQPLDLVVHVVDVVEPVVVPRLPVPVHLVELVVVLADDGRVEPVPSRLAPAMGPEAVEVLARERRAVSGPVEPYRQRPVGLQRRIGEAALVGLHAVVLRVLAGEDRRPRRAAQRVRRQRVRERHARAAQQLAGLGHPVQVARGHVVGADQDDVGPLRGPLVVLHLDRAGPALGHRLAHQQAGAEEDRDHGARRAAAPLAPHHAGHHAASAAAHTAGWAACPTHHRSTTATRAR